MTRKRSQVQVLYRPFFCVLKKIAIINHRSYRESISNLLRFGYEVLLVHPYYMGRRNIDSHADLQVFVYFKRPIVVAPNVNISFLKRLWKFFSDNDIIIGSRFLKDTYPLDISYNAIIVGSYFFVNRKYIDPLLLSIGRKKFNLIPIHVNQGYIRCTSIPLDNYSIITEDKGILEKAKKLDLDILYLPSGTIEIDDYNYGFLPGASGVDNNFFFVNGDTKLYPYRRELESFLNRKGIKIVDLAPGKKIKDIGSILFT